MLWALQMSVFRYNEGILVHMAEDYSFNLKGREWLAVWSRLFVPRPQ